MAKVFLNEERIAFIKANRLKISGSEIAKKLGCSSSVVHSYMRANNLTAPRELSQKWRSDALRGRTTFTPEQDQVIKANYLEVPVKRLAAMLGKSGTSLKIRLRQLGLVIPKELAQQRALDSQIKKGAVSFNKGRKQKDYMSPEAIERTKATRFKKGNVPHNTTYNGYERITKDGYIEVRISKGVFRLKHLHNWEELNGPLPESHCLRCIDGNIKNCEPSNWELITRAENMKLNSIWDYPEELRKSIKLVNKINRKLTQLNN